MQAQEIKEIRDKQILLTMTLLYGNQFHLWFESLHLVLKKENVHLDRLFQLNSTALSNTFKKYWNSNREELTKLLEATKNFNKTTNSKVEINFDFSLQFGKIMDLFIKYQEDEDKFESLLQTIKFLADNANSFDVNSNAEMQERIKIMESINHRLMNLPLTKLKELQNEL